MGGIFGVDKDIYKTPAITTTDKANLAGFNATVGFPWRVLPNTFLTGKLNYQNLTRKYDDGKERDNGFGLRFSLEDYLFCGEMRCDHNQGFNLSRNAYDQGSSFIDYTSGALLNFGNTKLTYNNTPGTYENSYNNINLNTGYSIYVIDYVAIGARLNVGTMMEKTKDIDFKYTWNTFSIEPNITANVPVDNAWRNLFVRGGYTIGSDTYKVQSGTINNTDKYKDRGFTVGLGWNSFFEKHTAFTGYAGYRSITTEDKSNGDEIKNSGLYLSGGLRLSF